MAGKGCVVLRIIIRRPEPHSVLGDPKNRGAGFRPDRIFVGTQIALFHLCAAIRAGQCCHPPPRPNKMRLCLHQETKAQTSAVPLFLLRGYPRNHSGACNGAGRSRLLLVQRPARRGSSRSLPVRLSPNGGSLRGVGERYLAFSTHFTFCIVSVFPFSVKGKLPPCWVGPHSSSPRQAPPGPLR